MNRRDFIKTNACAGLALILNPISLWDSDPKSIEELIGKGEPDLFGEGYKLRKEAHEAFLDMQRQALKEDINIQIVSSYRSFEHQNRIWNSKYERFTSQGLSPKKAIEKITEYSTIPGTSRHHWGTDIDIIDGSVKQPKHVLNVRHFKKGGGFHKLKNWLDENSESFGFYLVYLDDATRKGIHYEPWHYSYKPLSKSYLKEFLELDLLELLKTEEIMGKQFFTKNYIDRYVTHHILDINPELL